MNSVPPIPPVIAIPLAIIGMIVVAAHAQALARAPGIPESRRRIRLANSVLMLVTIPLLTSGFSLISATSRPRLWVMVWMLSTLLVGMILILAVLDTLNTVRLSRRRRQALREELSHYRAGLIDLARADDSDPRSGEHPDHAG